MHIKQYIQPILRCIGYYPTKAKIKRYFYLKKLRREDNARNAKIREQIMAIDHRILPEVIDGQNLTVSLTSYGKRVTENAMFAIYSILNQTFLPNRIVLNLDQTKWNLSNIPIEYHKLMHAGLVVNFCKDIGPYTKLLPTLKQYPNDIVVTIDDDILYENTLLEDLFLGYKKTDGKTIVCREARLIEKNKAGTYIPYTNSRNSAFGVIDVGIIPYGFRGVLYPPHVFEEEIFNEKVYRDICRSADDIWFGVVEFVEKIPVFCIHSQKMTLNFVNTSEQWEPTAETCLYYENSIKGKNDIQYSAVLKHFGL